MQGYNRVFHCRWLCYFSRGIITISGSNTNTILAKQLITDVDVFNEKWGTLITGRKIAIS